MDDHVYPAEPLYHNELEQNRKAGNPWQVTKVVEDLKKKAKAAGLWNLFLPRLEHGAGLTNLEYAPLCEIMGRSPIAPEAFNCSAPDTGNMEVWRATAPRAAGTVARAAARRAKIRSAFGMTEPEWLPAMRPTSSLSIVRDGDSVSSTAASGGPRAPAILGARF